MQHVVEEANASADGDLLGGGELGGMFGVFVGDDAFQGLRGFFRVCWGGEVG
jgi:hypothetical protein